MAGRPVGRDRAALRSRVGLRRGIGRISSPPPERLRAGRDTPTPGSQPVRELQRSLRRLGDRPGPVDGLYGPLTEAAVERFQQAHGLATDGVVGPQTKRRLLAQGAKRPVADTSRPTHTGQLARKSPSGGNPAESATEQDPARSAPSAALSRAGPPRSEGVPTELLALLAALASELSCSACGHTAGVRARPLSTSEWCALRCSRRSSSGRRPEPCSPPRQHLRLAARRSRIAVLCSRLVAHPATAGLVRHASSGARRQARGVRLALKARRPAPRAQVSVPPAPVRFPAPPDNRRVAPRSPRPSARPWCSGRGPRPPAVSEHVHRPAGRRALAGRGAPPSTQRLGQGNRQAGPGSRKPQRRPHRFRETRMCSRRAKNCGSGECAG